MVTKRLTFEVTDEPACAGASEDGRSERDLLLAGLLHDMASPLSALRIQAKLLNARHEGCPAQGRPAFDKSLAIIEANLTHLAGMFQYASDLANLKANGLQLRLQPLDLADLIPQAVEAFLPNLGASAVDWQSPGPIHVHADARGLTQVLHNLLSNATKYDPGGTVQLRASVVDGHAVVLVHDRGRGLAAGEIERLFRPYSQVAQPGERKPGGTGLGLYICKGIIEGHGGHIWATSPGLGGGSAFAFSLPVVH